MWRRMLPGVLQVTLHIVHFKVLQTCLAATPSAIPNLHLVHWRLFPTSRKEHSFSNETLLVQKQKLAICVDIDLKI